MLLDAIMTRLSSARIRANKYARVEVFFSRPLAAL
jgi:hypothetical protein